MSKAQELITARELAEALDLSVETVWRYTRENRIPHVEVGSRQYRYNLEDVVSALSVTTAREEAAEYRVEQGKKLTYQDYLKLPDEPGYRYELLEGVLVKEPAPNVAHQRVSRRLQRILEDYFWETEPDGEVFNAPLDVTFHDITVVQPDLLYMARDQAQLIETARIDGPPKLVVEVLSPSTMRKDRLQKLSIYRKAGVQHYWLVGPEDRTFECFSLRDGIYALVATGMDDEVVEPPGFPGLSIPLDDLWQGRRRRTPT